MGEFAVANGSDSLSTLQKVGPMLCNALYANETAMMMEQYPEGFCGASFDLVSCWPPTPYNSAAVIRCFKKFQNVLYDDTRELIILK